MARDIKGHPVFHFFLLLLIIGSSLTLFSCHDTDSESLAPPNFNIAGDWILTEINCSSDDPLLDSESLGVMEARRLNGSGIRIQQSRNDLVIIDLDRDAQMEGTIAGDQISYDHFESHDSQFTIYTEFEGAVRNPKLIIGIEHIEFNYDIPDDEFKIRQTCGIRYVMA